MDHSSNDQRYDAQFDKCVDLQQQLNAAEAQLKQLRSTANGFRDQIKKYVGDAYEQERLLLALSKADEQVDNYNRRVVIRLQKEYAVEMAKLGQIEHDQWIDA